MVPDHDELDKFAIYSPTKITFFNSGDFIPNIYGNVTSPKIIGEANIYGTKYPFDFVGLNIVKSQAANIVNYIDNAVATNSISNGNLSNITLLPGIYDITEPLAYVSDGAELTFETENPNDIFIIRAYEFNFAVYSTIKLSKMANRKNIFFRSYYTTLGGSFNGYIISEHIYILFVNIPFYMIGNVVALLQIDVPEQSTIGASQYGDSEGELEPIPPPPTIPVPNLYSYPLLSIYVGDSKKFYDLYTVEIKLSIMYYYYVLAVLKEFPEEAVQQFIANIKTIEMSLEYMKYYCLAASIKKTRVKFEHNIQYAKTYPIKKALKNLYCSYNDIVIVSAKILKYAVNISSYSDYLSQYNYFNLIVSIYVSNKISN